MNNGNLPAMPFTGHTESSVFGQIPSGLTKREHFAAMAMQGLLSSETRAPVFDFAERSVQMADALLAVLDRIQPTIGES